MLMNDIPCSTNCTDLKKYPSTETHIADNPELYNFKFFDLECTLRRNEAGCWCGYVQLNPSHPMFNKDYHELNSTAPIEITYAADGKFGFDCFQSFDYMPGGKYYQNYSNAIERLVLLADFFNRGSESGDDEHPGIDVGEIINDDTKKNDEETDNEKSNKEKRGREDDCVHDKPPNKIQKTQTDDDSEPGNSCVVS
jgi:hypothetical protein